MLRDITLGQYYPADSIIHKLDPRTKLFATLLFIISVFSFDGIVGFIVMTAFLFGVIALSKVPLSFMLRGLKAIMILLVIAGLFNLFLTPGQVLWSIWKIHITREGLRSGADDHPHGLSDHGIVRDDADDNPEPVDGRLGKRH